MIKNFFAFLIVFLAGVRPVCAEDDPLPTIISFTSDIATVILADIEAGTLQTTLRWTATGVTPEYRIDIHAYEVHGWTNLVSHTDRPLNPNDEFIITIRHPLTFAAPTYRLSIVDITGAILDERILVLAYNAGTETPTIVRFETSTVELDTNALIFGTAQIDVSWEIANRTPTTNIIFEQFTSNGPVSIELPRQNLWITSTGSGTLHPVDPRDSEGVTVRIRVIDLVSGQVVDEETLSIPVTGISLPV
jgi:hypothetical protein